MNKDQEARFARVALNAKSALAARMAERENVIISKLVTAYRSNTLDANQLYGAIATIAELRAIVIEAEHDAVKMAEEMKEMSHD